MKDEKIITPQDLTPTDLAYRKRLKKRLILFLILGMLGLFTALLRPIVQSQIRWSEPPSQQEMDQALELLRRLNFLCGVGCGLLGASVGIVVKTYAIMTNPGKLRKSRIESNDERRIEISGKAQSAAGDMLLFAVYLGGIIGGIFYPVLHTALTILVFIYLLSYTIAWWIYHKRM